MANLAYNQAKFGIHNQTIDLVADDIRVLLLEASGDQDADDDFVSTVLGRAGTTELTSTGYNRTGNLAGKAIALDDPNDRSEFDATDAVFPTVSQLAAETVVGYLVFKFVTNDADSIPILIVDSFTPITPNGSDITITWDAEGILQLT